MSSGLPRMSVGFPDKIVSIIIAVTAASGSFILGYLVGKNTPATPVVQSTAPKTELQAAKPQDFPIPMPSTETGLPAPSKDDKLTETVTAPPVAEDLKRDELPAPKQEAVKEAVEKPAKTRQSKPATKTQPKSNAKPVSKPAAAQEKQAKPSSQDNKPSKGQGTAYTVQAGAFKKQSEADYLRRILASRGYNVQITQSVSKGVVVYKVMTGDFNNKKDAVILALKLKNTEGINAFVKTKE